MDLTLGTQEQKVARAKTMLLWFAMISLFMTFAGLISAYIVSKERKDWLTDFHLPNYFMISTVVILLSSATMFLAHKALKSHNRSQVSMFLLITLVLGVVFISSQILGFQELINNGIFVTGAYSNVRTSFVYIITFLHILHVVAGLIVLLVVIYNHFKQRYDNGQTLGFELGVTFWHFLDFLWLLLISFFYFV